MRRSTILASFIASALSLAAIGCGTTKPPPEAQAPAATPSASPAPSAAPGKDTVPVAAPSAAPAGKETPKATSTASAAEASKPATPVPAVIAKEPAPVAAAAPSKPATPTPAAAVEPKKAAEVAEAPSVSAHAKVGPEKCMMCHRVQYASWNGSKHKAKGLDCEGCHGNGADYKTMAVMKDRVAATKAGLIMPGLVFCKKCHAKAEASMLPLVHAHKAK